VGTAELTEQVQAVGESHRPLLCAGWVHASHIRPREDAHPTDYADVPANDCPTSAGSDLRLHLGPTPPRRDRWCVGVLDGGDLSLPRGTRRFRIAGRSPGRAELLAQLPDLDTVVVAVGSGGRWRD
jgi:hypothetical protein